MLLSLDAGELADESDELWGEFDLLHIACGGHAGDDASMERLAAYCAAHPHVLVGAHPAYPDRAGFGRRSLDLPPDTLAAMVADQVRALDRIAGRHARRVAWVKPHGALYHDLAARPELAAAVLGGLTDAAAASIGVVGPPRGALFDAAAARRVPYLREGFADRRMRPDGSLVPRTEPHALVLDPRDAAAQAAALARHVDAIAVHADTPGALAIARAVRETLRGGAPRG